MQRAPRNPSRAIREKFRKRRSSLLKKADELAYMCQTDVYLILYRGDKFYTYSSTDRDDWPPSEEEMVSRLLLKVLAHSLKESRIDITRFESTADRMKSAPFDDLAANKTMENALNRAKKFQYRLIHHPRSELTLPNELGGCQNPPVWRLWKSTDQGRKALIT
ncbi:MAG: hypothetical protein Q9201_007754 [Fulgogasparrea decipioides]